MADAFWAFSLAFYVRPGVSAACIELQDKHGADVDLVLFVLWCASRGQRLSGADLGAADASVAAWRQTVVQPIRQARRALKPPPELVEAEDAEALRRKLLTAELEAERLQQRALEAQAPPPGDAESQAAARHNLESVARLTNVPLDAAPLAVLLQAFA